MIVLDTNVLSEAMKRTPDARVMRWLDRQPHESVWTTSVTVFEILLGLETMPEGKRRRGLTDAFARVTDGVLEGRVLDFDAPSARVAATIAARLRASGRPGEIRDVEIAGTVARRGATLATRNVRHFEHTGIRLADPWVDS